jgi:hypothetical protein
MKYDGWSFICIDSKCLNYLPHANFLEIQAARSKQTNNDAHAKSCWEWGKTVSKVNFNPWCFILNKWSQPNDILGTDRTKQVERMVGNRCTRKGHTLLVHAASSDG